MNIILIGFRCSGKTTAGKLLAEKYGRDFFDSDEMIESASGCSIRRIFEDKGEPAFREKEREIAAVLAGRDNAVFALGGGMAMHGKEMAELKKNGFFVWLRAEGHSLRERMEREPEKRPRLMPGRTLGDEIEALLESRNPVYAKLADLTIDIDKKTPDEIVREIRAGVSAGFF